MSGARHHDLATLDLPRLMAEARAVRDDAHGRRVTYSPKVFIPLTMLCRDRCGYCTFAQPPARLESPYLTPDQVLRIARAGAAAGCHEALFTLGEAPGGALPGRPASGSAPTATPRPSTTSSPWPSSCSTRPACSPTPTPAPSSGDELARLRAVAPSQGMMVESLRDDLDCHRGAPDKAPARRLATLEAAGELAIPFTTGILVGIGEDVADRIAALEAIAASHRRHGHVQEVIVQNFLPKAGTAMHAAAAVPGRRLPRRPSPWPG